MLLVIASKFFHVDVDERAEKIVELLPGGNCSGCGYPSCAQYAAAIVAGEAKTNLCALSSEKTVKEISKLMGVEAEEVKRMRAQVMCSGTSSVTTQKYKYEGISDCVHASKIGGGSKECAYGCIGLGTCVKSCLAEAISIKNGVAVVDYEKCKGCGVCTTSCPKNIIKLVPFDSKIWVSCNSQDKAAKVKKYCEVGCVGCTLCAKVCPTQAITIQNNLAVINFDLCTECGTCVEKCPRNIIASMLNNKKAEKEISSNPLRKKAEPAFDFTDKKND